jgi:hypothetical protein
MEKDVTHSTWSTSCLRPSPPLRQIPYNKEDGVRSPRLGRKPVRRKPGLWNLLIVETMLETYWF